MKRVLHASAGTLALATITAFWVSTVTSELWGDPAVIAAVKASILKGMLVLIPALMIAGLSGRSLAGQRHGPLVAAKVRRMKIVAANGLLILLPSAFYLAGKASAESFDTWFVLVQGLELAAGALNATLLALTLRDGLRLTGKLRAQPASV
ncbi:MAG: hypothetical protein NW223_12210 [Hyphomicrobiaceae bacterium]|nr:hypothetical protein [Hyphomicrobiaceae bacterium]